MELYQFIILISFVKCIGIYRILFYVFCLLMTRHLNKKYLSNDKKYKLFNKIKYKSNNKLKIIFENSLQYKPITYINNLYQFSNKYYKLSLNEIFYMFTDLLNEISIIKIDSEIKSNDIEVVNELVNKFSDKIKSKDTKVINELINNFTDKIDNFNNILKLENCENKELIQNNVSKSLELIEKIKMQNENNDITNVSI